MANYYNRSSNESLRAEARKHFKGDLYKKILYMAQQKNKKDYSNLISAIEEFIVKNGRGITSTQLRNIFAKVKTTEDVVGMIRLRPVLAYTAARQQNMDDKAKKVILLIDSVIQDMKDTKDDEEEIVIDSFKAFMEAIVAYHKFYHS